MPGPPSWRGKEPRLVVVTALGAFVLELGWERLSEV